MMTTRMIAALAIGAALVSFWMAAGLVSIAYVALFAFAIAPGLPLGFALFGRRHAAGWISGALIGYGLTQLALWLVIVSGLASSLAVSGLASTLTFIVAWLLLLAVTTLLARGFSGGPFVFLPEWRAADTRALLLVLVLVPVLMGPPYRNLGRADEAGNRYYRAYFTADFLWHSALAYELGNFALPPRNPYMSPRPMNYYWTYFLLPATAARLAPGGLGDMERCLKTNAMLAGLLMVGALFLLVRTAVASPWPAAAAVVLAIVAASSEGIYEIVTLVRQGRPLTDLLDTNIDAITAWRFGGLRVDNIPRSLWYTPQHTTSIALGLVGLLVASAGGVTARLPAIAGAGIALGLSTTMNPLLGAVCSTIYGSCVAFDAVFQRGQWRRIPVHALAALPVVMAVAWGSASHVMDGAGSALDFGYHGFSRHSPIVTLLLSLGPILVPAVAGLLFARGVASRPVIIGITGIIVGLFLLYFVRISEASWVGFRAGQVLLVSIPILLAITFEQMGRRAGDSTRHAGSDRRSADDDRRHLECARHRQPPSWPAVPLDPVGDTCAAGSVPLAPCAHPADRGRPDGTHGARSRALDADPVVCRTTNGGRPADITASATGIRAAFTAGTDRLCDNQCRRGLGDPQAFADRLPLR